MSMTSMNSSHAMLWIDISLHYVLYPSVYVCTLIYVMSCHVMYMQVRMFPNLYAAKAIEVVLVMGEVLYLPGG